MPEAETKFTELEILCEIPLKIELDGKKFEIRPLVATKLIQMRPHIETILNAILEGLMGRFKDTAELIRQVQTGQLDEKDLIGFALNAIYSSIDAGMECMRIAFRPNAKGDDVVDLDFLKDHLDFFTAGKILGFLVKTSNIGETVKNVVILKALTRSK